MDKIKLKSLKVVSFVTDLTDKEKETLNGRGVTDFCLPPRKTWNAFDTNCQAKLTYDCETIVGCYSLAETCEIYCVEPPVQETNDGGPGCQIPG